MTVTIDDVLEAASELAAQQEVAQSLGAIFAEARLVKGWGQREAADRLDTAQARISAMERGEWDPKLSTILKYAKGYGYDIEISVVPRAD